MKRLLIVLAVLFQLGALMWMAWNREDILRNGQSVELETAPVDPRDIFRGDYVRLDYRLSTLPGGLARDGLKEKGGDRGERIYTVLRRVEDRVEAVEVSDRKPEQGLYLRGRLTRAWKPTRRDEALRIKYGIEQYFVEQGHGLALEQRRRREDGLQTPLFVQLAVGGDGTAVIRSIRWGGLGIGLQLDPRKPDNRETLGATLTLENVSQQPLILLLAPEQCSFHLEAAALDAEGQPLPDRAHCQGTVDAELRALELTPGGSHQERFEFKQPQWHVRHQGKSQPIGELPWGQRYRIVYRSPSGADEHGVWKGEIRSAAFHGRGWVD